MTLQITLPPMQVELDHLFICTAPGAPEAEKLVQFGLREGVPNEHPGQGTACRRFPFANAMIELLWVNDANEAQGEQAGGTLLWERWSGRENTASPFGICVRPADPQDKGSPFAAREYRPAYLPSDLCLQIGEAGVEEPMWVHLNFMRRAQREQWFTGHPIGVREITGVTLTTPWPLRSDASQKLIESGVLTVRLGTESLLEMELDGHIRGEHADFRPALPLVFRC